MYPGDLPQFCQVFFTFLKVVTSLSVFHSHFRTILEKLNSFLRRRQGIIMVFLYHLDMKICRYSPIYGYSIVPHFFTIETSIAFIFKMPTVYPARKIYIPFHLLSTALLSCAQDYIFTGRRTIAVFYRAIFHGYYTILRKLSKI